MDIEAPRRQDTAMLDRTGVLAAIIAYSAWGFFPLYWQYLKHISSLEIMSHRVIWSLLFYAAVAIIRSGRSVFLKQVIDFFKYDRTRLRRTAFASFLIAFNWLLYIWGVTHGHVLETSLGYFMTPLLNVAIGRFALSEKLRRLQWISLIFATLGVLWLTYDYGQPPWIALGLATSFACYGLVKKVVKGDPTLLSTMETLFLMPLAIGAIVAIRYLYFNTESVFLMSPQHLSVSDWFLLVGGGAVTGLPLLLFGVAAQKLPLSTLGFFQYLAPTFQFLTAVFLFHEPLTQSRLVGFAIIWLALAVFVVHLLQSSQSASSQSRPAR